MTGDSSGSDELTDVRFVGAATAETLRAAGVEAADLRERRVSYAQLKAHGVNPGVAGRLRREHSLAWSFDRTDAEDMRRRSEQVRNMREEEREWVAASFDADEATPDGGETKEDAERAWRDGR